MVDDSVRLEVTIPPNTQAKVFVPATAVDSITVSGEPIVAADGVEYLGQEGDRVVLRVASGAYVFRVL